MHEWIGDSDAPHDEVDDAPQVRHSRRASQPACWSPPLTLLVHLARSALASAELEGRRLVWVGQGIWPHAPLLASAPASGRVGVDALGRSLFVRASHPAARLWATDVALRSRAVAAVIVDGAGFDLVATRRLQLAAEAGGGLCLLSRPPWERTVLSAAATRWLVRTAVSSTNARRWTVELLRCKGVQPATHVHAALSESAGNVWTLERDHATHALRLAADVLDRSGEAPARPARRAG